MSLRTTVGIDFEAVSLNMHIWSQVQHIVSEMPWKPTFFAMIVERRQRYVASS